MNAIILLTFDRRGLLCEAVVEATTEAPTQFASAKNRGRGRGTCTAARIEAKQKSYSRSLYLTRKESLDLALFHAARVAAREVYHGHGTQREIRIAHLWENLAKYGKSRDCDFSAVAFMLGAGWWRDALCGPPHFNEMASLIRCLDRAVKSDGTDESPYADADNAREEYRD